MYGSPRGSYDGDEWVTLLSDGFKCLYEWVIFSVLYTLGGNGEFIMAICQFYDLNAIR